MIAFDCPQCGKALIMPNARAHSETRCPRCGDPLVVPGEPPRARGAHRWLWLVPVVISLAVMAVLARPWLDEVGRPKVIQDRFRSQLQARSPGWKEIEWEYCDPKLGDYVLTTYFQGEKANYNVHVECHLAGEQMFVRFNPTADGYLADAHFHFAEPGAYDYRGAAPAERDLLAGLARDVNEALLQAIRK